MTTPDTDEQKPHYQIARVGISLPCSVPVVPNTPNTDAPMNQRTDKCRVDAWWFVGALPICDLHLRQFCGIVGDDYNDIANKFHAMGWELPNTTEKKPWTEMHRYDS